MVNASNCRGKASSDAVVHIVDLEAVDQKTSWHDLIATDDLPLDQATAVKCDGRSLLIYRSAQAIHVYDSSCPHKSSHIPFLALQGTKLTCPKYHWEFDITDGSCTEQKVRCALKEWPNQIEGERLLALW